MLIWNPQPLLKADEGYNPYRDEDGKFASGPGGKGGAKGKEKGGKRKPKLVSMDRLKSIDGIDTKWVEDHVKRSRDWAEEAFGKVSGDFEPALATKALSDHLMYESLTGRRDTYRLMESNGNPEDRIKSQTYPVYETLGIHPDNTTHDKLFGEYGEMGKAHLAWDLFESTGGNIVDHEEVTAKTKAAIAKLGYDDLDSFMDRWKYGGALERISEGLRDSPGFYSLGSHLRYAAQGCHPMFTLQRKMPVEDDGTEKYDDRNVDRFPVWELSDRLVSLSKDYPGAFEGVDETDLRSMGAYIAHAGWINYVESQLKYGGTDLSSAKHFSEEAMAMFLAAPDVLEKHAPTVAAGIRARIQDGFYPDEMRQITGIKRTTKTEDEVPAFDARSSFDIDEDFESGAIVSFNEVGISASEFESLKAYKSWKFELINDHLLGGIDRQTKMPLDDVERAVAEEHVRNIDNAFKNASAPEDMVTWRGTCDPRLFDDLKPGDEYTSPAYMSTSLNPGIAMRFADKCFGNWGRDGVLIETRIPKGTSCIHMDSAIENAAESEILLPRNSVCRVVDTYFSDRRRRRVVVLEYTGRTTNETTT